MLSEVAEEFDIALNAATTTLWHSFPRATKVKVIWQLSPWPGRWSVRLLSQVTIYYRYLETFAEYGTHTSQRSSFAHVSGSSLQTDAHSFKANQNTAIRIPQYIVHMNFPCTPHNTNHATDVRNSLFTVTCCVRVTVFEKINTVTLNTRLR